MPLPLRRLRDKCFALVATLVPLLMSVFVFRSIILQSARTDAALEASLSPLAAIVFLFFGGILFFMSPPRPGFMSLFVFHVLVCSYFLLRSFTSSSPLSAYAQTILAGVVPAVMAHFALTYFDLAVSRRTRMLLLTGAYLAAGGLCLLSMRLGSDLYAVAFWIVVLLMWAVGAIRVLASPHPEFDQIFSRSLLLGMFAGLAGSFVALLLGRSGGSLLLPLFPGALLVGVLPKRQEQKELYLVQSEKRASMGNVLSGLAHEINNPLTYIYSNMEPLRESLDYLKKKLPDADPKTVEVLKDLDQLAKTMEEGVTRAKSLVEKFRYYPSGQPEGREGVDLNKLISQSVDLLSHKWSGRLRVERRFEELPAVMGSATELGQVFTNLIANACDATPEGGSVTVSTYRGAASVKVSVRDTGKGIPKNEIRRIFDPFYSTKRQGEGMGLGLAITMQIVKNHGGSIEVRSEVGKGTEFLVILPYS